jgi:DNA repair exonuclease SbcCD ATPase subunit
VEEKGAEAAELEEKAKKREGRSKILRNLARLLQEADSCEASAAESKAGWETAETAISRARGLDSEAVGADGRAAEARRTAEPLRKRRSEADARIVQLQELTIRQETLAKDYEVTELVRNALDPLKGIPLYFIGGYLKETARITNELLDIAYGGKFRIDFLLDPREFRVPVYTDDGDVKEDVRQASQGELALTTISLSLALIEQGTGTWNIVCLDEIDAPLDQGNRSCFVRMLETQADRLGSEQLFVISHNNEFDAYPVDLVALPGGEQQADDEDFMQNKSIVFDWRWQKEVEDEGDDKV